LRDISFFCQVPRLGRPHVEPKNNEQTYLAPRHYGLEIYEDESRKGLLGPSVATRPKMGSRKNHNNNQFVKHIDHIHKFWPRPLPNWLRFATPCHLWQENINFMPRRSFPRPTLSTALRILRVLRSHHPLFPLLVDFRL